MEGSFGLLNGEFNLMQQRGVGSLSAGVQADSIS
jgi:hypothetical protein